MQAFLDKKVFSKSIEKNVSGIVDVPLTYCRH